MWQACSPHIPRRAGSQVHVVALLDGFPFRRWNMSKVCSLYPVGLGGTVSISSYHTFSGLTLLRSGVGNRRPHCWSHRWPCSRPPEHVLRQDCHSASTIWSLFIVRGRFYLLREWFAYIVCVPKLLSPLYSSSRLPRMFQSVLLRSCLLKQER